MSVSICKDASTTISSPVPSLRPWLFAVLHLILVTTYTHTQEVFVENMDRQCYGCSVNTPYSGVARKAFHQRFASTGLCCCQEYIQLLPRTGTRWRSRSVAGIHACVCVYIYVTGHTDSVFTSNDNCVRYCITARRFRALLWPVGDSLHWPHLASGYLHNKCGIPGSKACGQPDCFIQRTFVHIQPNHNKAQNSLYVVVVLICEVYD